MKDPTQRFSDRVENYTNYRPDYPPSALDCLAKECELGIGAKIADIGSGTGIFTGQLLSRGWKVWAVEPNAEMRKAAEDALGEDENFVSVAGRSGDTKLADKSVDLVVAAQAFHWFDEKAFKKECLRILQPSGSVGLIWNGRELTDPFQKEYHQMLTDRAPEYSQVALSWDDEDKVASFFGETPFARHVFANEQWFDREGFFGRMNSSSYVPPEGDPLHEPLIAAAEELFERYASGGRLRFVYKTRLYLGRLVA